RIAAFSEPGETIRRVEVFRFGVRGLDSSEAAIWVVAHDGREAALCIWPRDDRCDLDAIAHRDPHAIVHPGLIFRLRDLRRTKRRRQRSYQSDEEGNSENAHGV